MARKHHRCDHLALVERRDEADPLSARVCQIFCVNAVLVSGVRVASGPRIEWRSD